MKVVAIVGVVWVANSFVMGGIWSALNWRRNRYRYVEHGGHHQHDTPLAGEYTTAACASHVGATMTAEQSRLEVIGRLQEDRRRPTVRRAGQPTELRAVV
jgi:hypothetical protein